MSGNEVCNAGTYFLSFISGYETTYSIDIFSGIQFTPGANPTTYESTTAYNAGVVRGNGVFLIRNKIYIAILKAICSAGVEFRVENFSLM
jgi:hypothetical protein